MAANTSPIYPLVPYIALGDLTAVTACTTRAPTATASLAGANISSLAPATTEGLRLDKIKVKAASSSFTAPTVAQTVMIWLWDGTTAYIFDEIIISALTPSTTAGSFEVEHSYSDVVLPPAFALYMSTSITTTASTTALTVQAFGGTY